MERARAWVEGRIGAGVDRLEPLAGGAGARRYWRVRSEVGETFVLAHALPEDPQILPPALADRDALAEFLTATRFLGAHGVPVPAVLGVEAERRWLLLEDLGHVHLSDLAGEERAVRTAEAVELLARVHALAPPDSVPFRRRFDAAWARFELAHFAGYALPGGDGDAALEGALDQLADAIGALPGALSLRDVQSQNLMIDPAGRLRIIDYQDAFTAPAALDLAALLWDSYVEIAPEQRSAWLELYASRAGGAPPPDSIALLVVQRKCKDFGRFTYVSRVKGDTRFEPAARRARAAVLEALPGLPRALSGARREIERALAGARA